MHLCWLRSGCLEVKAEQGYHLCQWQKGVCAPGNRCVSAGTYAWIWKDIYHLTEHPRMWSSPYALVKYLSKLLSVPGTLVCERAPRWGKLGACPGHLRGAESTQRPSPEPWQGWRGGKKGGVGSISTSLPLGKSVLCHRSSLASAAMFNHF